MELYNSRKEVPANDVPIACNPVILVRVRYGKMANAA